MTGLLFAAPMDVRRGLLGAALRHPSLFVRAATGLG